MKLKSITTLLLLSSLVLFAQTGDASWYGDKYQGKPTASGEPFDMYAYTAANRTLPFGTIIKVTNLKNNKSVQVRINDRGPTKKSRIVDLSYQAAKDIGLLHDGIVPVKVEALSTSSQKNNSKESGNPYLTGEKSDQEYMKEYASKLPKIEKSVDYNEYLPSNVPNNEIDDSSVGKKNKKKDISKNTINVQVASFSSRGNAESFIETQRDSGYNMKVIELERASKTLYKVVVVCDSSKLASRIIKSERFAGAYILK